VSDSKHALVLDPETHAVAMQGIHPMVAAILARNPDAATLRELMGMQREWEANEARKAYAAALVSLKRDLPTVIGRDALVDFTGKSGVRTRYTHTSLAAVMDVITEPLTAHGFSLAWTPATTEKGAVRVTCTLTHAQGHSESATMDAPPDTSGSKNPAQAIASTVTLLSRYTALSLLGIATADMPDPAEPPAPSPATIDTGRNMRAAKAIADRGLDMGLACARVGGRGVAEWTAQDLDVLRAWIGPASSSASAPGLGDLRRQADAEIVRYTTLGVTLVALEAFYGRQCGEWGPDELADLRAKYPRIKQGENAANVFPPRETNAPDAAPEPGTEG